MDSFSRTVQNAFSISIRRKIFGNCCGTTATSLHLFYQHMTEKEVKKDFGQKTKRFRGFGGPWITKIQGPQNLDFSTLSVHSDKTQTRRRKIGKEGAKRNACILGVDPSALTS